MQQEANDRDTMILALVLLETTRDICKHISPMGCLVGIVTFGASIVQFFPEKANSEMT